MVTMCVATAFYNTLLRDERRKDRCESKMRKKGKLLLDDLTDMRRYCNWNSKH